MGEKEVNRILGTEKHKTRFQRDLGTRFLSPVDSWNNAGSKVTEVLLQMYLVVKTAGF